jgi:hypothetical protein
VREYDLSEQGFREQLDIGMCMRTDIAQSRFIYEMKDPSSCFVTVYKSERVKSPM